MSEENNKRQILFARKFVGIYSVVCGDYALNYNDNYLTFNEQKRTSFRDRLEEKAKRHNTPAKGSGCTQSA